MTIPVLEIDDKIITDSRDIQRYLTNKYPGKGDAEADKATIESFNECVCAWDEYLLATVAFQHFWEQLFTTFVLFVRSTLSTKQSRKESWTRFSGMDRLFVKPS